MKNINKTARTFLLIAIIVVISSVIMIFNKTAAKSGNIAVVSVDGKVVNELRLSEDYESVVDGYAGGKNKIVVSGGVCYMEEADCPDKLCIKQGSISKVGETIICLPHRVVVTIEGEKNDIPDTMAR